mmetsp:Transcript_6425/g.8689  ORF Transcript_6425/g.8689 Transcript_6425/m.8689 type:complete len:287 (-) Transcript_6425:466-1326(-)
MSAAAARRRKQKALKAAQEAEAAASGDGSSDPVILRLNSLLTADNATDESVAYEALQLAQSQVRRLVKTNRYAEATDLAYATSLTLLEKAGRVSVSSQLLAVLVEVLNETHTVCSGEWTGRMETLDKAYRDALERDDTMEKDERVRLGRLHVQFLRKALKWSTDLGTVRLGDLKLHELLGRQCWRMATQLSAAGDGGAGGWRRSFRLLGMEVLRRTRMKWRKKQLLSTTMSWTKNHAMACAAMPSPTSPSRNSPQPSRNASLPFLHPPPKKSPWDTSAPLPNATLS